MKPDLYVDALHFAARAHGAQRTPTGMPYVVHLASVAMEVMHALRAEPGRDEDLAVTCALLHDVVEDTGTELEAVSVAFGERVARGVAALTKDERLPKHERMADSLERILREPPEVAMVKLADRVTNLAPPPDHWTAEKIGAYREEARLIHGRLGHASGFLAARLASRIERYPASSTSTTTKVHYS